MKNVIRLVAIALMTVAGFATVTAPKTAQNPVQSGQTLSEGTMPAPCYPGHICR